MQRRQSTLENSRWYLPLNISRNEEHIFEEGTIPKINIYCDRCPLGLGLLELMETRVTTRQGPYARAGVHIWKCPRCKSCSVRRFAYARQRKTNL